MVYFHSKNLSFHAFWKASEWKILVHFILSFGILMRSFGIEKSGNPGRGTFLRTAAAEAGTGFSLSITQCRNKILKSCLLLSPVVLKAFDCHHRCS
jgi:hypothetical protein